MIKINRIFYDFDQKAKIAITEKLIDYKNDFWPEYDEDDENLNWDAVDAGEYNVTKEEFAEAITLNEIAAFLLLLVLIWMIYDSFTTGKLGAPFYIILMTSVFNIIVRKYYTRKDLKKVKEIK